MCLKEVRSGLAASLVAVRDLDSRLENLPIDLALPQAM